MQQSPSPWPKYSEHSNYYNPISQIRQLIKNLDAELLQLCQQRITPLSAPPTRNAAAPLPPPPKQLATPFGAVQHANKFSPASMISTTDDLHSGVHTRTLSSIYRAKVIDAYRNRRIFTVYGNYRTIRRALLRRGWLEKLPPNRFPKLHLLSEEMLLQHAKRGNDYEAVAISKIINHFPAFFVWQPKAFRDMYADVLPLRNRVRRSRNLDFSTKIGLIGCAENEQWYQQEGVCRMSYPRFYRLGGTLEERIPFVEDFRRTQCRCLVRFVVDHLGGDNMAELCDELEGGVQASTLKFANAQLKRHLNEWEHTTLDDEARSPTDTDTIEWQNFMALSNKITHGTDKFKASAKELAELAQTGQALLRRLDEKRPDYRWDGGRNLWILKPGYQSRGIGIIVRNSLDEILQWCNNNQGRRYIAQKYIERPLLIHKTKFDIRQYMLLSICESCVQLWMYKDCYLRFSSQEYTLDDLRESIHLTNNSVQKKYKINQGRDPRLPRHNMWSLDQFKDHLRQSGAPEHTWSTIYAGFKENLISVVMASLEDTEFTENSFELYGCDFMLDESYHPILIEINSTPDLSPSTDVTARICPNAMQDVVRVVVDLPRNNRASTGLFELVYEVNYRIKSEVDAHHPMECLGRRMTVYKSRPAPPVNRLNRRIITKPKKDGGSSGGGGSSHKSKDSGSDRSKASGSERTTTSTAAGTAKAAGKKATTNGKQAPKVADQDRDRMMIGGTDGGPMQYRRLDSFAKEALALRYTLPA